MAARRETVELSDVGVKVVRVGPRDADLCELSDLEVERILSGSRPSAGMTFAGDVNDAVDLGRICGGAGDCTFVGDLVDEQ